MVSAIETVAENAQIAKAYKDLLRISYQKLTAADKKMIRLALDTAVDAHKDQRRKSGEPYILHPIAVAKIVADNIGLGAPSIAAALLHDVVEDTKYTIDDIESIHGAQIAKIVDGLTKISSLKKDKNVSLQAENFRKMLLTLNDDARVIIIKIADRLHNMQTMDVMPRHKQIKIASETLYIYAPLAHRVGMYNIKTELEDLGLKYTEPEIYDEIQQRIQENFDSQEEYIDRFIKLTKSIYAERDCHVKLKGVQSRSFPPGKKWFQKTLISIKFLIAMPYASSIKLTHKKRNSWHGKFTL